MLHQDKLSLDVVQTLTKLTADGFCTCQILTDDDGRPKDYLFLTVNDHFEEMTGLRDAPGKTALELVPGLEQHWIDIYGKVALEREPIRFRNNSDVMGRYFEVYSSPIDPPGCFAIVFRDVSDMRRVEIENEQLLARSEGLLRELNHRVMNSFATMSAVIGMEMRSRDEGQGRNALGRVRRRIEALGELYRLLDRSGTVDRVAVPDYISAILDHAMRSAAYEQEITLATEFDAIELPTQRAVPLGLVVNELATNALKYAFEPGRPGRIEVTLKTAGVEARLRVADDGRGLDPAARPLSGRGRGLVQAFAGQLGGECSWVSGGADGGPGTVAEMVFPLAV